MEKGVGCFRMDSGLLFSQFYFKIKSETGSFKTIQFLCRGVAPLESTVWDSYPLCGIRPRHAFGKMIFDLIPEKAGSKF